MYSSTHTLLSSRVALLASPARVDLSQTFLTLNPNPNLDLRDDDLL